MGGAPWRKASSIVQVDASAAHPHAPSLCIWSSTSLSTLRREGDAPSLFPDARR